jgi:hypothetical protein
MHALERWLPRSEEQAETLLLLLLHLRQAMTDNITAMILQRDSLLFLTAALFPRPTPGQRAHARVVLA